VELNAPRVDDRRRDEHDQPQRFTSHILPPYMRRSTKVSEVFADLVPAPTVSSGDFRPVLEALLGEDAAGLSATNIARLTWLGERIYRLSPAQPERARVCLCLGGRGPLQHPSG